MSKEDTLKLVEFPKLGGYCIVPADAKVLILTFPARIDGQDVQVDRVAIAEEITNCLQAAGFGNLQVMLFQGLERVDILKETK